MMETHFYMAWANDDKILKSSASGDIFQALENGFLSDGTGCSVYGAWQDNDQFIVTHRGVDGPEDINLLIGSKYYQSE